MTQKDLSIIFSELKDKNPKLNLDLIENNYTRLINYYKDHENNMSEIHEIKKKIKKMKDNLKYIDECFYISFIAIMIKASNIILGINPREIQLICLLIFIFKKPEEGLIQQILTGEGKSLIITFLATIKAFMGQKVDILTSSLVLAERDALKMKKFYQFFDISVDYCRPDHDINNNEGSYNCYNADICYGDSLSFEGDILRSEFMGIKGRGKRAFECIIIDEIDNICLDNIKNITEIIDNFKGYKYLEFCYLTIYEELLKIANNKQEKRDKINTLINNVTPKILKLSSNIQIQQYIKDKFINHKIKKWCESAYEAANTFKKDYDYIIKEDKILNFKVIKPVDYSNTGVVEENSIWSGLHQFLQIKERLRMTEENINSCFMSNLTFFKKYIKYKEIKNNSPEIIESNIYGLTGTLGSEISQNALKILYNLNPIFIPSFKERQLIKEKEIIINEEKEYLDCLTKIIKTKALDEKRAVLVIFRYIDNVNKRKISLSKDKLLRNNIITYTRSDIDSEKQFLENKIKPGTIILSTNLSGRGTDIQLSPEVIENGGLHVILTFYPKSERIENQAFGRAARKGEKGSCQYVILSDKPFDSLEEGRKKDELNEFRYLTEVYSKKILLFENLFEQFSEKLKIIRKKEIKIEKNKEYIIEDIKERWALFLVENDLSNIDKNYKDEESLKLNEEELIKIKVNFHQFIQELEKNTHSLDEYIFQNNLLLLDLYDNKDYNLQEMKKGSPIGAYVKIILNEVTNKNYKNSLKQYFLNLKKECLNFKRQEKLISAFYNIIDYAKNTDLSKQFTQKKKFIDDMISRIEKNEKIIEQSGNNKILPEVVDITENREYPLDIYQYYAGLGIFFLDLKIYKETGLFSYLKKLIKK